MMTGRVAKRGMKTPEVKVGLAKIRQQGLRCSRSMTPELVWSTGWHRVWGEQGLMGLVISDAGGIIRQRDVLCVIKRGKRGETRARDEGRVSRVGQTDVLKKLREEIHCGCITLTWKLSFIEGDADGDSDSACGRIVNQIARGLIRVTNQDLTDGFGAQLALFVLWDSQIGSTAKDTKMRQIGIVTVQKLMGNATSPRLMTRLRMWTAQAKADVHRWRGRPP
eukprot:scaffold310852_cov21-Prasinocladus_malaysianus.AAC.1